MGVAAAALLLNDDEDRRRRNAIIRLNLLKKVLRDTSDPFSLDPEYFRKHYRLTPDLALMLVDLLHNQLEGDRTTGIPPVLQILSVIRFLSEGSYQKGVANNFHHPVSQATMSRMIDRVINAILTKANRFISFPNTQEERVLVSNGFLRYNRIQRVLGLIDCFKVAFWKPTQNEEAFFNYNAGTSMNVQVVCDVDYIIRNIRICPGSNTDYFIWQFSDLKQKMDSLRANLNILQEEGRYYLIGDNGYNPSPIMLTPIVNAPENSPQAAYTQELVSTRCKVEQCFGILTSVWLSINRARKLHYAPEKVAKIILACAVLHNFRKLNGMIDVLVPIVAEEQEPILIERNNEYQEGIEERNRIINNYYAN